MATHSLQNNGRNQTLHRAAQVEDPLDKPGADVGVFFRWHHKDRLQFRSQAAIHQRHLELVFIIADGPDAAQHSLGALLAGKLHQQAVKGFDGDVVELTSGLAQHLHAIPGRKERRLLFCVVQDGDDKMVKDFGATGDEIQMAVGGRIEAAGIDGANGIHNTSDCMGSSSRLQSEWLPRRVGASAEKRGNAVATLICRPDNMIVTIASPDVQSDALAASEFVAGIGVPDGI